MTNILLLEDLPEIRFWLKQLVLQVFPNSLISEAARVHDARELITAVKFDMALIDLGLPDGSGVDRDEVAHHPSLTRPERSRRATISARVTFLGSGTSTGVPMIGCACAVCRSDDPRDKRLRPSICVEVAGRTILVDTTPDLRQQALAHGLTRLDAVLFTHSHADHILGLDDIRRFNFIQGGAIPCYATADVWENIRRTFYYIFDGIPRQGGGIPRLDTHEIAGPFEAAGIRVVPVPLFHGQMPILGFRFGDFAYLTDCSAIPGESWALVAGLETLVIDALRDKKHATHFTVDEALEAIARIAPGRAYLTHMSHDLGHAETNARLPRGVELAYDGLSFDARVDAS